MARKKTGSKTTSATVSERGKPRVKPGLKDLPNRTLSGEQAKDVKGGGKHIAGVKYEDITNT